MSVYTETHVVVAIIIINYKEDERSDDQRVIQVYLACIHALHVFCIPVLFRMQIIVSLSIIIMSYGCTYNYMLYQGIIDC